jgi:hypothetical protein
MRAGIIFGINKSRGDSASFVVIPSQIRYRPGAIPLGGALLPVGV